MGGGQASPWLPPCPVSPSLGSDSGAPSALRCLTMGSGPPAPALYQGGKLRHSWGHPKVLPQSSPQGQSQCWGVRDLGFTTRGRGGEIVGGASNPQHLPPPPTYRAPHSQVPPARRLQPSAPHHSGRSYSIYPPGQGWWGVPGGTMDTVGTG